MSAITRYLAMLRLFGMLLCAAAIPSVATATVPVTVAVAASDVEEEAVEASAVGAEAEAARDAGYESAEVPALARRVTDLTATLDAAERARLEASLAALEARKGAQVAILMVPSTYPDSIEAYATRVFEAWKLGRKGIDDGVLVLVAKDDRRMRIEVGYGLEGTITDIDAGRIIREYMTPAFRQQDYAGGLEAAAQRLVRLIDGEALPPPPRDPLEPGAVRQTLAIAFLLGALGGVALLVRPRAWYWTLGAVVALAAALALGRHWPAGAMVALAEMVAVLGVGFGALLKYSRGARWFFAILVLYALGLFWAYRRYGLPVLHYGLAVPLSLGLTLLMLAGAWQVLHKHAHELLGHEEVQQLLQLLARSSPKLAEELVPGLISLSTLLKVLQALLQEQVPVRDIRTIAEAIANVAPRSQDPGAMVAAVRVALSRAIVQSIVGLEPELPVITLEPRLEQILLNSMQKAGQGSEDGMLLEPGMAEKLQRSLIESAQRQEMLGKPAILLVAGPIRSMMSRFARMAVPSMHVLAYQEIPDNKQVTIVATVGQN